MNTWIYLSLIFFFCGALFALGCVLSDLSRYVRWARKNLRWQRQVKAWERWS